MPDTDAETTETEPTPGPWETEIRPDGNFCQDILGAHDGYLEVVATVRTPGNGIFRGDWKENARLIAAAGTAAHELPDEYDPIQTQKAQNDMITALEKVKAVLGRRRDALEQATSEDAEKAYQLVTDALQEARSE